MSIEFENKFQELEDIFATRDRDKIVNYFKCAEIPITRMDENTCAGDYAQVLHNFTFGSYNLPKAKNVYICFTFIYKEEIDPLAYGYKDAADIMELNSNFVFEVFFKETELTKYRIDLMLMYANHLKIDMYMSVSTFLRPERKAQYAYNTNAIIIDLDVYNTKYADLAPITSYEDPLYEEMKPIFEEIGYEPSIYLHSGRGRYLVFRLENNVNLSKASMQNLYKEVVTRLIEKFKPFGADSKCKDLSRVFHMVGNINSKTQQPYRKCNINFYFIEEEEWFKPKETMYNRVTPINGNALLLADKVSLTTLADNLGIHKSSGKQFTYYPKSKKVYNIKYSKVNKQRNIDFNTLLELRDYNIKGHRDYFFHLCSNNAFYTGYNETDVLNYLISLNNKLVEPLSISELKNIVNCDKKNYELFQQDTSKAIKYTNRTIVELLNITKSEQEYMLQLIDDDTANNRDAVSNRKARKQEYEVHKEENEKNRKDLMTQMRNYKIDTLSNNKQVAEHFNLDERTVDKMLNGESKFVTVGQMDSEKLIKYYTNLGYSVSRIAEMLNISERMVYKYKKQIEEE